jgi:kynurenine formamidase
MSVGARLDREGVLRRAERYRNWGRWGPEDELGTLNLVTHEKVRDATRLIKKGKTLSLAIPLDANGPQTGAFGRTNPLHHFLQDGGDIAAGAQDHIAALRYTDDAIFLMTHGATHWDALAHIYHDGKMYNGYGTDAVTSGGATRNSIMRVKDRMVGRGVLLDMPRHRGKPWLEASEPIHAEDLEACAEAQGVEVGEGDFVLVRTGQLAERRARGAWGDYAGGPAPGLAISASDFFCPRGVAAVATDTWGTEVLPNETDEVFQPLHLILLLSAGIHLGEMFDLEELAEDCAADRVYEFFFAAPPLTITGGVGSPINPQAIK